MAARPTIPPEVTNVAEVQKNMQNDVEGLQERVKAIEGRAIPHLLQPASKKLLKKIKTSIRR